MPGPFAHTLHAALPLTVDQASWGDDEVLILSGAEWSLAVTCAWRVVGGHLLFGWESEDARALVARLAGLDVVGCEVQSTFLPVDPRFLLADGTALELFAAHHLEPWVMTVRGTTFVASPSDAAWVEDAFDT
ncbi:hypothetical protein F4560_000351 [Saccharothrix ecbatanensis]|uniref:Uncharacterized protein n=1 Tax=Saccharothrix ecbatanensis TaxID=1105145 RepID=A0A7W9HE30_9PSEU|nr:hypothetical protein [Saccharothrix ecbatanensis]MBB5800583.1 hypothetical protein [Saccharothrix ecbatanensis]